MLEEAISPWKVVQTIALLAFIGTTQAGAHEPIALHPENPHYFV